MAKSYYDWLHGTNSAYDDHIHGRTHRDVAYLNRIHGDDKWRDFKHNKSNKPVEQTGTTGEPKKNNL